MNEMIDECTVISDIGGRRYIALEGLNNDNFKKVI